MSGDLAAWLRPQVEARLMLAREACDGTNGHWWRRTHDLYGTGEAVPVGPLVGGEPVIDDEDGEVLSGEFTVVYDEGHPSEAEFEHMEANDPRAVIAGCESELAILDLCERVIREDDGKHDGCGAAGSWTGLAVARLTVGLLASGYKHRDGYQEERKQ